MSTFPIFDSHAHYDDEAFDADREDLLQSFPSRGIVGIVNAGASLKSSRQCVSLAKKYPYVFAAVGIHPEEAENEQPGDFEAIEELAASAEKVVAVGEIGLDYHYGDPDREKQKNLFERQLLLANRHGLPVIIHDRDAHGDTLELVNKYRPRGVLHCFSGSAEMAKEIVRLGMYLGFTGSVTFKNNKKAHGVLAAVPRERILIETDCPYMAPEPLRGRRCDSTMLTYTLERISALTGITPEEAAELTLRNAEELFGIHVNRS